MAKAKDGNIAELKQDNRNANSHKERGKELLQKSVHELGAGRSVLVDANNVIIAGNNSTETAIAEGITKTVVVETTGDTLVVVKRTDLDLNDPGEAGRKARKMAIVDNSSALAGIDFDIEAVQEIEEQWGFDVQEWGIIMPGEIGDLDGFFQSDPNGHAPKEEGFSITLNYTEDEFRVVKDALAKVAKTPEQAVWQLLNLGE
jgi:hypothetical protein